MTVVFESPRFRVHITDKVVWVEQRESTGWVFRAQLTIPVSFESLDATAHSSTLKEAVADFEESRPGDTSLRSALTGYRAPVTAQIVQRDHPRRVVLRAAPRTRMVRQFWSREPLRPPLAAKTA